MPTPMHIYRNLAVKYGNVDPGDTKAINRFFEKDVYHLSRFTQLRIISTLFRHNGDRSDPMSFDLPDDDDEDVPAPNPANYKRADSKKR